MDIAALVGVFALTAMVTSASAEHWPPWRRTATLLAEAAITYLPLIMLGTYWADMAGFLAGSALLLLSGWVAWSLFTAVIASMIPVAAAAHVGVYGAAYLTLSTLVLGLVVWPGCPSPSRTCTRPAVSSPSWRSSASGCGSPGTCMTCWATACRRSR